MTFEINRLRAVLLALAMLLTGALLIGTTQPSFADAAAKKTAHHKKKKHHKKKTKKGPKKGPAGLRFYHPPKQIPKAHGKLIWQRKAGGAVPLKNASATKLVLYTSKNLKGKEIAVSGSVSIPKGKAPKGGWPVVTYAHGTTGIADKCAPSRNVKGGIADPYINYTDGVMNAWLKAGYAVARTDYQGLGVPGVTHQFLVGVPAGRSVLDIVSASRQLGFKVSNKYLIAGHSQGGQAALFAAGLASSYGKGINLRGTVSYAPASHFKKQATLLPALTSPSSLTALATLLVRGMSTAYPEIDAQQVLSDAILPYYPSTLNDCLSTLAAGPLGGIAPSELLRDGVDLEPLYGILDAQNPALKTSAPILLAQGSVDTTTFPFLTNDLDTELTGLGDTVDYKTYEGIDHGGIVDAAEADVMSFFESRLPGGK